MEDRMNYDQIVAKLGEMDVRPRDLGWDYDSEEMKKAFGTVSVVKGASTGGEDEGSAYRRVLNFEDQGVFIAITGYYTSYDGTEWDNYFTHVTPREKTITVYE